MKMYVVATNINTMTARLTTEYTGLGGPINIPTATGKAAVQRYLESMQSADAFKTISPRPWGKPDHFARFERANLEESAGAPCLLISIRTRRSDMMSS